MKRIIASVLCGILALCAVFAQTQTNPQKPLQENKPEDVVRVTTELVQSDVVVTDKNDQIVPNLRLEDFELFENGRKQDLQFIEYVSIDIGAPRRTEGSTGADKTTAGIDTPAPRELTFKDVRRVLAFVVDDVTIPSEDMARVRGMLSDFVEHKMLDGDLVAIARTVGSEGLLEQFTSDRQILRRAVAQIGVRSIPPYLAFSGPEPGRITKLPSPVGVHDTSEDIGDMRIDSGRFPEAADEGANQVPRALLALTVSNFLVDSLRQLPGRKNLILLSGGLPMFSLTTEGSMVGDITQLFRQLTDNATRSGVVINTMDVRGLKTSGAVARFVDTPAKSALGGGTIAGTDENASFARTADTSLLGAKPLTEQLTLRSLASRTGGISVVDSNNFSTGLDRVLGRSRGYYLLGYRPSEKFDNKFHRVEIKVRLAGARVYAAEGYFARDDKTGGTRTKEKEIIAAVRLPLAKRDLDVVAELQYKFSPANQAQLDIKTVIDARKLNLKRGADGKYHASLDVVGFVFDQLGKSCGGVAQTINADLTETDYQQALNTGISYTASTELPPGYYQVRLVVREAESGRIGTVSRYFEVPDLSNKQLTMSSILLYEVNPTATNNPQQLPATRVISRQRDLRYAVIVYNAKSDNNKPQAHTRLIVSQGGRMLFQEPATPVQTPGSSPGQFVKVGQLGLSKVNPGRYVLTILVTDPLADKKHQTVARSIDFTVVN